MSRLADDDRISKYNKIWKKKQTKNLLTIKFDSQPVYDEKYIKTIVKTFESKVITKITGNELPKQNIHVLL